MGWLLVVALLAASVGLYLGLYLARRKDGRSGAASELLDAVAADNRLRDEKERIEGARTELEQIEKITDLKERVEALAAFANRRGPRP